MSANNEGSNLAQMVDHTKLILKRLRSYADREPPNINEHPFYAWQCVTLYLQNKTIDFVFENDDSLFTFINFIQTSIIDQINVERLKKLMNKKSLFGGILKSQPNQLSNKPFVAAKPDHMKNFRFMKVKMKIAYTALKYGQPILDFFINAILKAFVDHGVPAT